MIGTNLLDWFEPFGLQRLWSELERDVHIKGKCGPFEFHLIKNNLEKIINVNAALLQQVGKEERGTTVSVWRDVTDQIKLEERLRKSETLAGIGKTATMVGHDLRNPLQVITNIMHIFNNNLKKSTSHKNEVLLDLSNDLEEQIRYMDKIVSDLQFFSKNLKLQVISCEVKILIEEILQEISLADNISIEVNFDKGFPNTPIDPNLFRRVVINLVTNAFQAMPKGGKLKITGNYNEKDVRIGFKDTGVGIPRGNLVKIFSPLFTTKAKGQGFGLPVCEQIINLHGGNIKVESIINKGSTFIVILPRKKGVVED